MKRQQVEFSYSYQKPTKRFFFERKSPWNKKKLLGFTIIMSKRFGKQVPLAEKAKAFERIYPKELGKLAGYLR